MTFSLGFLQLEPNLICLSNSPPVGFAFALTHSLLHAADQKETPCCRNVLSCLCNNLRVGCVEGNGGRVADRLPARSRLVPAAGMWICQVRLGHVRRRLEEWATPRCGRRECSLGHTPLDVQRGQAHQVEARIAILIRDASAG